MKKITVRSKITRTMFCTFLFLIAMMVSAYAGEPTDQVKQGVDKVLDVLKNRELKRPDRTRERRAAIRKIVGERFDYEEMAKRSLAQYWRQRTPEERKEFVPLYSDLLEKAYINKIEMYRNEKVLYTGENVDGNYAVVKTKVILTKKNIEIPIDYKILKRGLKWIVYDVGIEGVSLVNNYRNQFNQIIRSGSYQELVKKLKSKQIESPSDRK